MGRKLREPHALRPGSAQGGARGSRPRLLRGHAHLRRRVPPRRPQPRGHEGDRQVLRRHRHAGLLRRDRLGLRHPQHPGQRDPQQELPARAVPAPGGGHQGGGERAGDARAEHQGPQPGHAHSGGRLRGHGRHDPRAHRRPAPDRQDQDGPDRPDQAVRGRQLLHRPPVPGPGRAVHPERRYLAGIHGRAAPHREIHRPQTQGGGGRCRPGRHGGGAGGGRARA